MKELNQTNIKLLTNENYLFLDELKNNLNNSDEIFVMTAFGTMSGFKLLENEFKSFSKRGGKARFCFDISQGMTEPKLIEELTTYPGDFSVKVGIKDKKNIFLHNKIYYLKNIDKTKTLFLGSNNFTLGGLKNNYDSSILLKGKEENIFLETENYLSTIWNNNSSIDIANHDDLFNEYKKLFNKKKKINTFEKEIEKLSTIIEKNNKKKINQGAEIFYILGVITAKIREIKKSDLDNGILKIRIKSQPFNSAVTKDKGFITNVIDGNVLGGIRLDQNSTMLKESNRIGERIKDFFMEYDQNLEYKLQDRSLKNFNVVLEFKFSKSNLLLDHIRKFCKDASYKNQILPKIVKSSSESMSIHYLRGYADVRSRVSASDRLPNGQLRIVLGVGTGEIDFLEDFHNLLEDKFKFTVNKESGQKRGKDNMLRITAEDSCSKIFQSGWKRAMANEFAKYNLKYN